MSTFLVSIGRPSASFYFLSMLFHMIHCVDLTVWVCLLVCKQRISRATRESFNNPGDRGQVSLTMHNLGVNEPAQYTVSTKDGRMMIDAKGWSRFKSKSYLAVGDDVKIELSRQGELVQICRISGSGRPLRFEHWGVRGDYAFYLPVPHCLAKIKAMERTAQETQGLYWF